MISFLEGRLLQRGPEEVVVEVNGVGYGVQVPLSTFYHLPEVGERVRLLIHTHMREESLSLFGFLTERERRLFRMMIGVSGVGPKMALTVLSGISPEELERSLTEGDVATLVRIPGIGRRTAERMVIELRGRLLPLPQEDRLPPPQQEVLQDALSALINLGYRRPLAEKVLRELLRQHPSLSLEDLLREALRELAQGP